MTIETNRYSVPAHLVGRVLTARIHPAHLAFYLGSDCVALHARHSGQHARIIEPAHLEAVLAHKPRGRSVVYRDWLRGLSPTADAYVSEICQKRRAEMAGQIRALYDLAHEVGLADFCGALELAAEQHMYGAEYVRAIVLPHTSGAPSGAAETALPGFEHTPRQKEVDRDLAQYEQYVANRDTLMAGGVR